MEDALDALSKRMGVDIIEGDTEIAHNTFNDYNELDNLDLPFDHYHVPSHSKEL